MPPTQESSRRPRANPDIQRQRILDAAQACFVEHGFHAAGMSAVARAADMSPGLIYRYFSSKREIILAIIERQLELTHQELAEMETTRSSLAGEILNSVKQCAKVDDDRMKPALYAEMSAEASRDPDIAAATSTSDRSLRDAFSSRLQRSDLPDAPALPASQAKAVSLLTQCLVDGLRLRQLREPDFNHAEAKKALDMLIPSWLQALDS